MGEAENPGPSRRRRTQRSRALQWAWDSHSELEDDHRNVVPWRADVQGDVESVSDVVRQPTQMDNDSEHEGRVPPDVVEALEQDLCEDCGQVELAMVVPTDLSARGSSRVNRGDGRSHSRGQR